MIGKLAQFGGRMAVTHPGVSVGINSLAGGGVGGFESVEQHQMRPKSSTASKMPQKMWKRAKMHKIKRGKSF